MSNNATRFGTMKSITTQGGLAPMGLLAMEKARQATLAALEAAEQEALWAQPRPYANVAYGPARMALYEQSTPVTVTYVRRGHRTLRMSFTYGGVARPALMHAAVH